MSVGLLVAHSSSLQLKPSFQILVGQLCILDTLTALLTLLLFSMPPLFPNMGDQVQIKMFSFMKACATTEMGLNILI